jgi:YfiH family protein
MTEFTGICLSYTDADSWAGIPVGRGLLAGISLQRAGDMGLSSPGAALRRRELVRSIGWTGGDEYALRQVHSRIVVPIDARSPQECREIQADGLSCGKAGLLLTVTVADCLPIFIADRRRGAYAIVHSGWKGTGILLDAVGLMRQEYGSRPEDLSVTIGPGIGACCYSVPMDRWDAFRQEFGPASVAGGEGAFRLDLRRANVDLLRKAGISDLAVVEDCTACSPDLGSYRRQGPGSFTRMLAFIGKAEGGAL